MLKHMPKDALKKFGKMSYSKENVVMPTCKDRREHNTTTADNRTDDNRTQRMTKFSTQLEIVICIEYASGFCSMFEK